MYCVVRIVLYNWKEDERVDEVWQVGRWVVACNYPPSLLATLHKVVII